MSKLFQLPRPFSMSLLASAFAVSGLLAASNVSAANTTSTTASSAANATSADSAAKSTAQIAAVSNTVELVFVLDTTGSMGGLLEGAKSKIWGIINEILQKRSARNTHVKVGLVGYRDRGDSYVTKVTPLSDNLDDVYAQLMAFRAEGGGDMPEDVRSAMQDALQKVGWSKPAANVSQIMFLVGDAPPHEDYKDVLDPSSSAKQARALGMIINTIQCGNIRETTLPWRNIAQYGGGEYFAIAQDGGVQNIATPYDVELAALGEKIGGTYMAYGRSEMRVAKKAKQAALESSVAMAAPAPVAAERAVNKALNKSAYDEADLLQKLESGSATLSSVKEAELPDELRALKPEERQAKVDKSVAERKALRARILELSKQREQFLAEATRKAGKQQGFDAAVAAALAKQIK